MRRYWILFLFVCGVVHADMVCPDGFVAVAEPDDMVVLVDGDACPDGYAVDGKYDACANETDDLLMCYLFGVARALCASGMVQLNISGGESVPLYAERMTTPSLCVLYNDTVCYADVGVGALAGTLNVMIDNDVYHLKK